ncbi:MAG: tRNA 2-thiouridine(34) synthase MnmA [Phycisphaeraceae bacterium]|nr:MAG: tRNA 2-thiouridine(34) synthase MnmA [Phycisphaeraceae bacterium]
MSGGVDSSVAAALLKEQGHEVVGVFMRLGSPGETIDELRPFDSAGVSCDPAKIRIGHQGCCSINDAADARLVAAHLGIPLYVCNFKRDFGRIIDYFVDEYAAGRTPNPCVRCNDWLKFGKLHEYAAQIGADAVASGHYARVGGGRHEGTGARGHGGGEPVLLRGVDHSKDQSYVLFGIDRARLAAMMLPIGGFSKGEIREKARELGLPVFDKPDSQEICFVPDNDYAGLVERRRPELAKTGAIVDSGGHAIGEHGGQHRFTIGQRRGVGVALGHRIYVVGRDPETNRVTVGGREDLVATGLVAREANWLVDPPSPGVWADAIVQYRYNSEGRPARVCRIDDADEPTPGGRMGRFEVEFNEPVEAVAPGQAAVVYDAAEPDLVLGGGWIERAMR